MSVRDLYGDVLVKATLAVAGRTANATGTTVDRAEDLSMFHSALVIVHTGAITDGTHTIEVQDSEDGTTWAAVADAFLRGTEPAIGSADDNKVYEIGYRGLKRYLRVNGIVAGATVGGTYGAVIVLGHPTKAPVVRN